MQIEGRVGPAVGSDGVQEPVRLGRTLEQMVSDAHARYYDAAYRSNIFSLYLSATTTTIAAGNIEAAAAGASTQFAVWNPKSSDVVLVLLKFGLGLISGTPAAGAVSHSLSINHAISIANVGNAISHKIGNSGGSRAGYVASAAGTALTGSAALIALRTANFAATATAGAAPAYVSGVEEVAGDIILMPGMAWVPTHRGAGTTALHNYSATWEEIPL